MSNLRDFTGKNRVFTGTDAETISSGTTAQRVNGIGKLRFNTTTNLMEYYTGTDWKSIDAPPTITAFTVDGGSDVTSATIDNGTVGDVTIEVKGSLFDTTGAVVTFVGTGETLSTSTITRNSANLLTVTLPYSGFDSTNEPYTIKVTNGSGLSAELQSAISADQPVVFTNAADTTYTVTDGNRTSGTILPAELCGATDADGDTITYSVSSGSLPTGFTLDTADGSIDWSSVPAVGTNTTTTFTIQAATTDLTITRQFKIQVNAPVQTEYTSGSGTFSVPPGVSSVDVLVVAGGGSGGQHHAGGGGAGGLIYRPGLPVTPGGSVSYSVGGGGPGGTGTTGNRGTDSTFGPLTAKGGGGGGANQGPGPTDNPSRGPGGSGGGRAGGSNPSPAGSGIQATQPTQPGDSGTYGFGNNGGDPGQPPTGGVHGGGGGGGAGGAGAAGNYSIGGPGGVGRAYTIADGSTPVYYAGGGGGSVWVNPTYGTGGNGGGGNGQAIQPNGSSISNPSQAGTANRGGGGGGSDRSQPGGAAGGSGYIVVSY